MDNQGRRHAHAHDMTNSHLLLRDFDYHQPATVKRAVELLSRFGSQAAVLAGGTFLLVQMKMEQVAPEAVVNVAGLPALCGVESAGGLSIGAMTTIWTLRNATAVSRDHSALHDACAAFGSTQVQLAGTIGGNLCSGSPASDTVPALMVLGAELDLMGPDGERRMPIDRFLMGPGETALQRGELLTRIRLPEPAANSGSGFVKISRVRADLAKASAAARVVRDGDWIADCQLAFGAVGPRVARARAAEEALVGQRYSRDLALKAGEIAARGVSPIDDIRSSAWYRRRVVRALCHDALSIAWSRAGTKREEAAGGPSGTDWERSAGATVSPFDLEAGGQRRIELTVNGVVRRLMVPPNELLINVLRERLQLTGTKYGCGIGECGACTVHVDGVPTLACLTLAVTVDGRQVTTVEGLSGSEGELDPLQEAFIEHAAFQCGYCTPGMLMMTKRLLSEDPSPDEDAVRDYLKGNRCRCTGFAAIVRAVESCAGT